MKTMDLAASDRIFFQHHDRQTDKYKLLEFQDHLAEDNKMDALKQSPQDEADLDRYMKYSL